MGGHRAYAAKQQDLWGTFRRKAEEAFEGKMAVHQEIEETLLKPYLALPYPIIVPMCIHWDRSDTHLDHASYCLGEFLMFVICIQQYQFCQTI